MSLLDKVKAGAEQAAAKAKEGVQEIELKRELGQLQTQLGAKTFELYEAGELTHPMLDELVGKLRSAKSQLAAAAASDEAESPTTKPPVMPVSG